MNGYLLDTNVISEASRPKPNRAVLKWFEGTADGRLFLSAITVGELRRGASLLPESERRAHYERIIVALQEQFEERILPFDGRAAGVWGDLGARCSQSGMTMQIIDSMLAATALTHGLTMVTRNVDDFKAAGITLLNPFV